MEVGLVVGFCLNGNLMGFEWVLMVVKNGENGGFERLKMSFWVKIEVCFDSFRDNAQTPWRPLGLDGACHLCCSCWAIFMDWSLGLVALNNFGGMHNIF